MKRLICLTIGIILTLSMVLNVSAEEAETLPIPEMPSDFYIIDESGLLDKRTVDAILEKGDALFAVTGAQVVFIVVAEDDKTDLGELAQQTLDAWELGSVERDNGIVLTMSFERGRVSYAVGEGISELYNSATMQELITSHRVGDYFADGQYDRAVLALYNDIYLKIQEYYEIDVSFWDKTTYAYEAKYDYEFDYTPVIISAAAVLFFIIVIIISAVHRNKKMKEVVDEVGDETDEEEMLITETENIGELSEEKEISDGYNTDEGEYNTEVGEYNTSEKKESYYTFPEKDNSGEWKYN